VVFSTVVLYRTLRAVTSTSMIACVAWLQKYFYAITQRRKGAILLR